jgi:tetratricopeptide (TPR) repeat protein
MSERPADPPLSERALQRLLAMAAHDEPEPVAPPALPGRYEIVRELGRGGMGVVYEVVDHQLGRRCALKTLSAGAGTNDELRRRFVREATAAARLRHPHIAAVFDATPEFITMQLVDGGPIGVAPALPARAAVALVRDAALALQHAHEQGVVHRDLKPSNLLVEGDHVFVVDFGLAKSIDAASSQSLRGSVVGTPAFMPPEQALGQSERIDARSDVYGLGATLYACVTGAPPFPAKDLPTLLRSVVEAEPPPTGVDRDLDLVLAKCLAKEPERRYASMRELADDLQRWLRDEPVHARPPSLAWRLRKRLRRQRSLWRAAAVTALAAGGLTALVLAPIALREGAARTAANEAVELADHVATVLQDAALSMSTGDTTSSWRRLDGGIERVRDFLGRHDVPRVRYLLARLLQARVRKDEALVELDLAIAADAELVDARFERGLLLASRSDASAADNARALADLRVGVRDRSVLREVDRLFGRAELLRLSGDNAQAIDVLREVIEHDGMHVPARLSMAAAARAIGDADLARYWSASAMDVQQGYGPHYLLRERAAMPTTILGLDGALVDVAATLRDTGDNATALAHRGIVHLRRALRLADDELLAEAIESVDAALGDHRMLLAVHGDLAGGFNNRAVCWLVAESLHRRAGNADAAAAARQEASTDLAAALQAAPALAAAHFNAGLVAQNREAVLRAMGRVDAAAREHVAAATAFGKALQLAPAAWPHAPACRERLAACAANPSRR